MEDILKEMQSQITLIGGFVGAFVLTWLMFLVCKVMTWFDENFQVKKTKKEKEKDK